MLAPFHPHNPPPAALRAAALAYAARGWFVFPLIPRAKRPKLTGGYHGASRDVAQINAWWDAFPTANIGIALAASKLVAYDCDSDAGKAHTRAIKGQLTDTLVQHTRAGGFHLIYSTVGVDVPPLRDIRATWEGVDLLSDGYVVAAPSVVDPEPDDKYPHVGSYAWANRDTAPAPCPEIVAGAVRELAAKRRANSDAPVGGHTPLGRIPDGQRNVTLFRVGCGLVELGMAPAETYAALDRYNQARCVPPLGEAEVRTIVKQAHRTATNTMAAQVSYDIAVGFDFTGRGAETAADAADEAADAILARFAIDANLAKPLETVTWLPTPFPAIDAALGGGLPVGRVSALAAPPASGKTGLALQLATHAAQAGTPVLYVSTEIEYDELAARMCALRAPEELAWRDLISGQAPDRRAALLAGLPITIIPPDYISSTCRPSVAAAQGFLTATIRALQRKHPDKPPLVVIDYLQLLVRVQDDNPTATANAVSNMLVELARDLRVAILVISSTSRDNYGRNQAVLRQITDPSAFLGVAKSAGDLEFDSSVLIFLDVDSTIHAPPGQVSYRAARAMIAKSRYGEPAAVGLRFHGARGHFAVDAQALVLLAGTVASPRGASVKPIATPESDLAVWHRVREALRRAPADLPALMTGVGEPTKTLDRILSNALDRGWVKKVKRAGAAKATRDVFELQGDHGET